MPRKPKKIPQIISEEDIQKIFHAIINEKRAYNGGKKIYYFRKFRNCMIFFLMYYLGLRPKASYAIKIEHIDLERGTLFIPASNNKQRNSDLIPLPEFVYNTLFRYIKKRNKLFEDSEWLFPSDHWRSKGHLDHSVVCKIFKDAARDTKLLNTSYVDAQGHKRANFTPYNLRHSFGSKAYEKTKDIKKTAFLLIQYDWQCRSALVYIHTTQNKNRIDLFNELYGE